MVGDLLREWLTRKARHVQIHILIQGTIAPVADVVEKHFRFEVFFNKGLRHWVIVRTKGMSGFNTHIG